MTSTVTEVPTNLRYRRLPVDPTRAEAILTGNTDNRPVDQARVNKYAKQMATTMVLVRRKSHIDSHPIAISVERVQRARVGAVSSHERLLEGLYGILVLRLHLFREHFIG